MSLGVFGDDGGNGGSDSCRSRPLSGEFANSDARLPDRGNRGVIGIGRSGAFPFLLHPRTMCFEIASDGRRDPTTTKPSIITNASMASNSVPLIICYAEY